MNRRSLFRGLVGLPFVAAASSVYPRVTAPSLYRCGLTDNGPTHGVVYNIDLRGADPDTLRALPELLRKQAQEIELRIVEDLRRRRF